MFQPALPQGHREAYGMTITSLQRLRRLNNPLQHRYTPLAHYHARLFDLRKVTEERSCAYPTLQRQDSSLRRPGRKTGTCSLLGAYPDLVYS